MSLEMSNSSITLIESSFNINTDSSSYSTCDITCDSTCDSSSYTTDTTTDTTDSSNYTTDTTTYTTTDTTDTTTDSTTLSTTLSTSQKSINIHSRLLSIETLSIDTISTINNTNTNVNNTNTNVNNTNVNVSLPILPPRSKSLHPILPLELWNAILKKTDLKKSRLLNKKFNLVSNDILIDIYTPFVDSLSISFDGSFATYRQLKLIKTPQMDHFKQFLLSPTTMENLNEIIWYTNAQIEVQSVCECLVRLFGAFPDLEPSSRISWNDIRKILRRSDFKLWLQNLAVHVEFIDIKDTKKVEQIIRVDPLITYERLREVSMAAYRLLILVAASLQFSTISDELEHANRECREIERKLKSASDFLGCLSS